jgi:uncharacterized protein YggE
MYRSRAAASVLVALTSLAVLSSLLVGGRPAAASTEALAAEQVTDSVLVTGAGAVSGEPDTLIANFAVETTAPTVYDALGRAGTAATQMRDALVRAGLTSGDLQTSNISISSQRDNDGKVTGYTVNQGIQATFRDLPKAGAIMSGAIAASGDAARLEGVWFSIEHDAALMAEARSKAFADARAKAELYARETGRPLGRVIKISEVGPGDVAPGGYDSRVGASSPVPIEPGRLQLTATVTVQWALQPAPAQPRRDSTAAPTFTDVMRRGNP